MDIHGLPQLVKTSIAVWLPVLVVLSVYGVAYVVANNQANAAGQKAVADQWACQTKVDAENRAAIARGDVNNGVETCQVVSGGDPGVHHGFLWLPYYQKY